MTHRLATAVVCACVAALCGCTKAASSTVPAGPGPSLTSSSAAATAWSGVPTSAPADAQTFNYGWGSRAVGHATTVRTTAAGEVTIGADMDRPAADGTIRLSLERAGNARPKTADITVRPGQAVDAFGLTFTVAAINPVGAGGGDVSVRIAPSSASASPS